ncbi:hypothetical protein RYX36_034548 [Vicia faba]
MNDAMVSDVKLVNTVVIEKCNKLFNGLESLVDVGGGTSTMEKPFAKSFPQLWLTVFDLPHVVDGLQGTSEMRYNKLMNDAMESDVKLVNTMVIEK